MSEMNRVKEIAHKFDLQGNVIECIPYGSGHINNTYRITRDDQVYFVLQKINTSIFTMPVELMENVVRITEHIAGSGKNPDHCLKVIPALDGKPQFIESDGGFWRMYNHINNTHTIDRVEVKEQAFEAARMFGSFLVDLKDLPGEPLHDTIPYFHYGPGRYQALKKAFEENLAGRRDLVKPEMEVVEKFVAAYDEFQGYLDAGKLPLRTTHNDTKINNVMLDNDTNKGVCVIDLDTTMPGYTLYDFGDMARTFISPTEEDETDLSIVYARPELYEELVKGFLTATYGSINHDEVDTLFLGGKMITLNIGIRFLTDYLNGDKYFKIHRPNHNMDRCRTQLKLVQSMEDQAQNFKDIIENTRLNMKKSNG